MRELAAQRRRFGYRHLHVRGAVATLEAEDGWVTLGYATVLQDAEGNDQVGDAAVASIFNIMRALCGPDWNAAEVRFSLRRPVEWGPYRRYFRAPLRFDAEQYAGVFEAEWLTRRLGSDDPMLHRLLQQQIDTLESRHGDDFHDCLSVQVLLHHFIGSCCGFESYRIGICGNHDL